MPEPADRRPASAAPSWAAALLVGFAAALLTRRPLASTAVRPTVGHGTSEPSGAPTRAAATLDRKMPVVAPRKWSDILRRVYASLADDRVLAVAAGVTFYALLAIFPAITALVSLYGLVSDPATISDQLASLSTLLPSGAIDIVGEQVKRIASKPHGSLGFGFALGLVIALWSANAGVKALFDALNVVNGEKEERGFFKLNAVSLLCTLGGLMLVMAALGAVVVVPVLLSFVSFAPGIDTAISLARWPLLLCLVLLALAVLFRVGPSRPATGWRWFSWGAVFAAVGWVVGSMAFSLYVAKFGTYNETYGSLGAAIGFLTWIWISVTIVLLGAEVNAAIAGKT